MAVSHQAPGPPATEQAIRAALADNPGRLGTHWDGCSTYHWACGVTPLLAEIDRLRAEIARLTQTLADL
jgi:hypothetical protein